MTSRKAYPMNQHISVLGRAATPDKESSPHPLLFVLGSVAVVGFATRVMEGNRDPVQFAEGIAMGMVVNHLIDVLRKNR